jgi:hypothetical protein
VATPRGLISVGHTKVMNTYRYEAGSAPATLRDAADKALLGAAVPYVKHVAYMYLMYFIAVEGGKVRFSDSYLPVPAPGVHGLDYVFSIFFPLGLVYDEVKETLLVSGGYGDHCCLLLWFGLQEAWNACVHDAEAFAAKDYGMHLLDC